MTPQNTPLEISEEVKNLVRSWHCNAAEAGDMSCCCARCKHGVETFILPSDVQLAINSATAKLREENTKLQKQIMGLREAFSKVVNERKEADILCDDGFTMSFHKNSPLHKELLTALSESTNFSHLYVRREVLEKLVEELEVCLGASCTCLTKSPDIKFHSVDCRYRTIEEAITLVRKELGE